MEAFIFTSDSPWGQGQVKVRSNKVKSPNTKFSFWNMPILSSFASGFQKWQLFWCTTITNAQKIHFKNIKNFVTALFQNPWAQVKFFLTARCAVDTESSDIETTSIASVVFPVINFGQLSGRIKSVCIVNEGMKAGVLESESVVSPAMVTHCYIVPLIVPLYVWGDWRRFFAFKSSSEK